MSIYRSPTGKRTLEACYDASVERLDVDVDERTVDTRHGSTHVLFAGAEDAPPVLVLHGGNATNPMTLAWYTDLADEYRLIAPDTIGQPGMSSETRVDPKGDGFGEWIIDVLDAFDIAAAPMIGTSYGAGVVLRMAALAPERIDSAALVVPAGFGTGPMRSLLRVGLPAVLYRYVPRPWLLDRALGAMVTDAEPDPVVRETIAASLRYVDLEREFPGADAAELADFDAPVAVYLGENDPFFPPDPVAERARERLSGLERVEVLDDEKHMLSRGAQRRVTESIRTDLMD